MRLAFAFRRNSGGVLNFVFICTYTVLHVRLREHIQLLDRPTVEWAIKCIKFKDWFKCTGVGVLSILENFNTETPALKLEQCRVPGGYSDCLNMTTVDLEWLKFVKILWRSIPTCEAE